MTFTIHEKNRPTEASITSYFQEQFNQEALHREKQRSGVLVAVFSCGFIFAFGIFRLIFPTANPTHQHIGTVVMLTLVSITAYELFIWFVLRYRMRHQLGGIPEVGKFVNATMEISLPSLGLYMLAPYFDPPITVLLGPFPLLYFLFIILSTLRLNFFLSLYTGAVAAAEFLILSLLLLSRPTDIEVLKPFQALLTYASKSFILLLSGAAAGFVAHQIKGSIHRSIATLEQQNQVINLFGQQISREIVNEMLKQNGSLQSSLRRVCIMFIDIRNFTNYAEKRTPQEVVAYQNAFFGIIIEVVNQYHGIINQFLGDGCMVTFGAPVALENSCQNAVQAGLAILNQVAAKVKEGTLPLTKVGIGLHVGEAVTGNIGTDIRQQYSITGNVVILASRIEQLNKDFDSQMLVSEEVIQCLTGNAWTAEPIGPVHVKGREEDIVLYRMA